MSDTRLRQAEQDYHAGRIDGQQWRDVLLRYDPERLTFELHDRPTPYGWRVSTPSVWTFNTSEGVSAGAIMAVDASGNVRPATTTAHSLIGIAVTSAAAGETVNVAIRTPRGPSE